jgi:hypothetical protein
MDSFTKTRQLNLLVQRCLQTIHPYYNGGDVSALANYPDTDKSLFLLSGDYLLC